MKISGIIMMLLLLVSVFAFAGCSGGGITGIEESNKAKSIRESISEQELMPKEINGINDFYILLVGDAKLDAEPRLDGDENPYSRVNFGSDHTNSVPYIKELDNELPLEFTDIKNEENNIYKVRNTMNPRALTFDYDATDGVDVFGNSNYDDKTKYLINYLNADKQNRYFVEKEFLNIIRDEENDPEFFIPQLTSKKETYKRSANVFIPLTNEMLQNIPYKEPARGPAGYIVLTVIPNYKYCDFLPEANILKRNTLKVHKQIGGTSDIEDLENNNNIEIEESDPNFWDKLIDDVWTQIKNSDFVNRDEYYDIIHSEHIEVRDSVTKIDSKEINVLIDRADRDPSRCYKSNPSGENGYDDFTINVDFVPQDYWSNTGWWTIQTDVIFWLTGDINIDIFLDPIDNFMGSRRLSLANYEKNNDYIKDNYHALQNRIILTFDKEKTGGVLQYQFPVHKIDQLGNTGSEGVLNNLPGNTWPIFYKPKDPDLELSDLDNSRYAPLAIESYGILDAFDDQGRVVLGPLGCEINNPEKYKNELKSFVTFNKEFPDLTDDDENEVPWTFEVKREDNVIKKTIKVMTATYLNLLEQVKTFLDGDYPLDGNWLLPHLNKHSIWNVDNMRQAHAQLHLGDQIYYGSENYYENLEEEKPFCINEDCICIKEKEDCKDYYYEEQKINRMSEMRLTDLCASTRYDVLRVVQPEECENSDNDADCYRDNIPKVYSSYTKGNDYRKDTLLGRDIIVKKLKYIVREIPKEKETDQQEYKYEYKDIYVRFVKQCDYDDPLCNSATVNQEMTDFTQIALQETYKNRLKPDKLENWFYNELKKVTVILIEKFDKDKSKVYPFSFDTDAIRIGRKAFSRTDIISSQEYEGIWNEGTTERAYPYELIIDSNAPTGKYVWEHFTEQEKEDIQKIPTKIFLNAFYNPIPGSSSLGTKIQERTSEVLDNPKTASFYLSVPPQKLDLIDGKIDATKFNVEYHTIRADEEELPDQELINSLWFHLHWMRPPIQAYRYYSAYNEVDALIEKYEDLVSALSINKGRLAALNTASKFFLLGILNTEYEITQELLDSYLHRMQVKSFTTISSSKEPEIIRNFPHFTSAKVYQPVLLPCVLDPEVVFLPNGINSLSELSIEDQEAYRNNPNYVENICHCYSLELNPLQPGTNANDVYTPDNPKFFAKATADYDCGAPKGWIDQNNLVKPNSVIPLIEYSVYPVMIPEEAETMWTEALIAAGGKPGVKRPSDADLQPTPGATATPGPTPTPVPQKMPESNFISMITASQVENQRLNQILPEIGTNDYQCSGSYVLDCYQPHRTSDTPGLLLVNDCCGHIVNTYFDNSRDGDCTPCKCKIEGYYTNPDNLPTVPAGKKCIIANLLAAAATPPLTSSPTPVQPAQKCSKYSPSDAFINYCAEGINDIGGKNDDVSAAMILECAENPDKITCQRNYCRKINGCLVNEGVCFNECSFLSEKYYCCGLQTTANMGHYEFNGIVDPDWVEQMCGNTCKT
ncbi:MAG: hypothetical protein KKF44_00115 [Nanoarchaeota archaeon]|nr:hypothetical protein [Nanoarchaeota archaeon]